MPKKKPRELPQLSPIAGVYGDSFVVQESGGIENRSKLIKYALNPVKYAYEVLKVKLLTPTQELLLNALHEAPYKTLARSGNNVGKDFVGGVAINYWMDCFDPCAVITSGPNEKHTKQVLWGEVRKLRMNAGLSMEGFFPENAEWKLGIDHYATALNVDKIESYQGRHLPRQLYVLDEATAISHGVLHAIQTMFDISRGHAILLIFNPFDITSVCYAEEQAAVRSDGSLKWRVVEIASINHPNIAAQLQGKPKPIPNAVSLEQFREWLDSTDEIDIAEYDPDKDLLWPPREYATVEKPTRCYRHEHSPEFQSRALGIWPSESNAVWSKSALDKALADLPSEILLCERCGKDEVRHKKGKKDCCGRPMVPIPFKPKFPITEIPKIGCDTATGSGGDWFAATGRWGDYAILHEESNTMDAVDIAGKLRIMCDCLATLYNKVQPSGKSPITAHNIPVNIDDDGTGRAVCAILWRERYYLRPISGAASPTSAPGFLSAALPTNPTYPNIRSQLWFEAAFRAKHGGLILGALPKVVRERFRQQVTGVRWKMNLRGQHEVERKQLTKERIGRSPDTADSVNLCFFGQMGLTVPKLPGLSADGKPVGKSPEERHDEARARMQENGMTLFNRMKERDSSARRRGLFGLSRYGK